MREMKESNIFGVGKIPNEWSCRRVKFLLSGLTDGTHGTYERVKEGYPLLSAKNVFEDGIRIGDNESQVSKEDYDSIIANGYPQKGDILLCCVGTVGRCTIYQEEKPYAFQRSIVFMRPNKDISSEMLKYAMQCDSTLAQETVLVNQAAQAGLYQGAVRELRIPLPLDFEQQQIVAYLDAKCDTIDNAIAHKRSVIEKLKEYRTAVITKAVTKGLNPDAEMKDSGIVWIGQIPKEWNIVRIKHTSWLKGRIGWDGLKSDEFIDKGPYLITGTDFINGIVNWDTCVHITEERFNEDMLLHVKEGDLLITKDGTVGKVAIAKNCPSKTSLNSGIMIIRNNSKFKYVDKFMYYVLSSPIFKEWFNFNTKPGTTILHLYQGDFYNFRFALPTVKEQESIASYLDAKCNKIDTAIHQQEQAIAKLEEYRKSVIYYAVTGKIDCRKAV